MAEGSTEQEGRVWTLYRWNDPEAGQLDRWYVIEPDELADKLALMKGDSRWEIIAVREAAHEPTPVEPEQEGARACPCGVSTCPGNDGDPCNYEDYGDTKAMPRPAPTEQEAARCPTCKSDDRDKRLPENGTCLDPWHGEPTPPTEQGFDAEARERIEEWLDAGDEWGVDGVRDFAALLSAYDSLQERVEELEAQLENAYDLAEEGWAYASDYFREKWDADDRLRKVWERLPADVRAKYRKPEEGEE